MSSAPNPSVIIKADTFVPGSCLVTFSLADPSSYSIVLFYPSPDLWTLRFASDNGVPPAVEFEFSEPCRYTYCDWKALAEGKTGAQVGMLATLLDDIILVVYVGKERIALKIPQARICAPLLEAIEAARRLGAVFADTKATRAANKD